MNVEQKLAPVILQKHNLVLCKNKTVYKILPFKEIPGNLDSPVN